MRHLAALLTVALFASALAAQYGAGSITGTLDLDPARWIVADEGEQSSTWRDTEEGAQVRIVAEPEVPVSGGPGTLTIEMEVRAGPGQARARDARIAFEGADETLVAGPENIDLSLGAFQVAGEDLVLAGSLVATLTPETTGSLVMDPDEGVTLDGNFQATIRGTSADRGQ